MNDTKLLKCFKILSSEAKELYLRSDVQIVDHPINPLEFYRDWVSPNIPVVIKNAVQHWPAIRRWTNTYLRDKLGNKLVKVAATPNGYADAIAEGYFVMPEEMEMTVNEFLSVLENPNTRPETVLYVQSQNGNLSGEWLDLLEDCESDLGWATEAFGEPPTAANFWMGDQRAVTSMHRDPFENIYCVVRGYKDFILHAPIDLPWIPYATLPMAKYKYVEESNESSKFKIIPLASDCNGRTDVTNESLKEVADNPRTDKEVDISEHVSNNKMNDDVNLKDFDSENECQKCCNDCEKKITDVNESEEKSCKLVHNESEKYESSESISSQHVPWICIDPEKPDLDTYPLYAYATQVKVRVHAGDMLFLPAYWFHHVKQSHACVAVNYWYDVRFDHRHAHQALITALLRESKLNTGCPPIF